MPEPPSAAIARALKSERKRTKNGLNEPSIGNGRLLRDPLIMGVDLGAQAAPTIGLVTTNTSITGSVIEAWNSVNLRLLGPNMAVTATNYGRPTTQTASYAFEFMHDGLTFEVVMRAAVAASACRVMVDGEWASAGYQGGAAGSVAGTGDAFIQYTFADARPRHIIVQFSADSTADVGDFRGIAREKIGVVWAPEQKPLGPRVVGVGDSWMFGTGVAFRANAVLLPLCRALGWKHVVPAGRSGSGYLKTSGSFFTFRTRAQADVYPLNPDVVIVIGSINDSGAFTKTQIQTEADLFYTDIKANVPNCKLIVIGPQNAGGAPSQNTLDNRDAVQAAALANTHVDLFIDPIATTVAAIDNVLGFLRGTGKTSATNGSGNSDRYVYSDGLHLVEAGYRYWAYRCAEAIAAWIAAGMPRAKWIGNGPLVLL